MTKERGTTGRRTRPVDLFPPLRADHPLFKRGFVIGMQRSGATPPAPAPPKAHPPDTSKAAAEVRDEDRD